METKKPTGAELERMRANDYRQKDGRYALRNSDRLCVCGHTLGAHVSGGHNCIAHEVTSWDEVKGVAKEPESTDYCDCEKFRHDRKKKVAK